MSKKNMSRRESIEKSAAIAGSFAGLTALGAMLSGCEKDTLKSSDKRYIYDVSGEALLQVEGGAVSVTVEDLNNGRPVIIIRSGETKFTVLSAICTHQGCSVMLPQTTGSDLTCPCHASKFSQVDGSVKQGPATDALTVFTSSYNSEEKELTIYS